MRRRQGERGGIVVGWLVRVLLGIALTGVLIFEAGAVIVATVAADNAARLAAQDGVAEFARSHDEQLARKDAQAQAQREETTIVGFSADAAGVGGQERVTVTVEKRAKTLFIHRIGFLRRFTRVRSTSRAFSV